MKSSGIILSSFIVAGLLLVVVQSRSHNHHSASCTSHSTGETNTTTTGTTTPICGRNMVAQECNPCNQLCEGGPLFCAQFCLSTKSFCGCNVGYCLPASNSSYCIQKSNSSAASLE